MWPFRRRPDPDPLLGEIKRGVVAGLAKVQQELMTLELAQRSLRSYLEGEIDRIDASVLQVRGLASSQMRQSYGGRPAVGRTRELQAIGERFANAIATPEGRAELIAELQGVQEPERSNGHPAGRSG